MKIKDNENVKINSHNNKKRKCKNYYNYYYEINNYNYDKRY